jgi:hypothetical protein
VRKPSIALVSLLLVSLSCGLVPGEQISNAATPIPTTEIPVTETAVPTFTPVATLTPTIPFTPTITFTPSITPSPTFAFPTATVNKQAHCRYGPSVAYLHAADLYPGDTGTVRGRHPYSTWHYVKFDKLDYFCWVAPSVVDVVGDVSTLYTTEPNLVTIGTNQYGPPKNVTAFRNGDQVTISWDQVNMTGDKDRGYFIEAFVCQGGFLLWWTFSYPDQFSTSYTVKDEAGCPEPSRGQLYTVEKHGYSQPVDIPWPPP